MSNKINSGDQYEKSAFAGLVVSVAKIFVVLVITMTFVIYIATPPDTRSFFSQSTQSDTIVRTVQPV